MAFIPTDDQQPLYAAANKIYSQSVRGRFRRIKWWILLFALAVYYLLPFVRWDRGPTAPSQAVLIDFPARRFYFFFIEIWPQEIYYLTGLLVLAAMTLFLMNAVAGRVWCGYLCPQTVWTDLFLAIERLVEGDRRERMLRDQAPWTVGRFARRTIKYFLWLMVAWWTGGAWVLYFADAPTLVKSLATGEAPFIAYVWIGILTATTYVFAGHMREQVCLYMCPWPRIQAALTDEQALNVTYRGDRGEPRMSVKKGAALRAEGQAVGDCIDCHQCVYVCPTGVDIRNGPDLGCIQCGLCIDACDSVMEKVGRPLGLIAYDNEINVQRRSNGLKPTVRLIRPRTVMYASLILVVSAVMLIALAMRETLALNVIHDRNPLYVQMGDGSVRNSYTIRVINKSPHPRSLELLLQGLEDPWVEVAGQVSRMDGKTVVEVGADQTREIRLFVTDYVGPKLPSKPLSFFLVDQATAERARSDDFFRAGGA